MKQRRMSKVRESSEGGWKGRVSEWGKVVTRGAKVVEKTRQQVAKGMRLK